MSVAGPSAPSQEQQDEAAAKGNVRATIPAIEAYNADNTGVGDAAGYAGISVPILRDTYDSSISEDLVSIPYADSVMYCVESTVGSATWSKKGPGADIRPESCSQ